ncbi:hypothetical protein [Streptomyces sp. NPDC059063]|uniref:hypothetical protein n=1 Tax=unclassified Streptomyces TaxID=2593676 RepID=UPI00367B397F
MKRAARTVCAALLLLTASFAAAPSAGAQPPPAEQNYVVDVVNHSRLTLDEVNLAVARHSDPTIRLITQRHVTSGATATFDLGACSDVRQFAASAFVGSREVLHTGNINPNPSCRTQIEITQDLTTHRKAIP